MQRGAPWPSGARGGGVSAPLLLGSKETLGGAPRHGPARPDPDGCWLTVGQILPWDVSPPGSTRRQAEGAPRPASWAEKQSVHRQCMNCILRFLASEDGQGNQTGKAGWFGGGS